MADGRGRSAASSSLSSRAHPVICRFCLGTYALETFTSRQIPVSEERAALRSIQARNPDLSDDYVPHPSPFFRGFEVKCLSCGRAHPDYPLLGFDQLVLEGINPVHLLRLRLGGSAILCYRRLRGRVHLALSDASL